MSEGRVTIITLRVPWDPETEDHPAGWGWDVLLNRNTEVDVVGFMEEMEDPGVGIVDGIIGDE